MHRHIEGEAQHDGEGALATFHSPKYEAAPLGVSNGGAEVRNFLNAMLAGFADRHIEPVLFDMATTSSL